MQNIQNSPEIIDFEERVSHVLNDDPQNEHHHPLYNSENKQLKPKLTTKQLCFIENFPEIHKVNDDYNIYSLPEINLIKPNNHISMNKIPNPKDFSSIDTDMLNLTDSHTHPTVEKAVDNFVKVVDDSSFLQLELKSLLTLIEDNHKEYLKLPYKEKQSNLKQFIKTKNILKTNVDEILNRLQSASLDLPKTGSEGYVTSNGLVPAEFLLNENSDDEARNVGIVGCLGVACPTGSLCNIPARISKDAPDSSEQLPLIRYKAPNRQELLSKRLEKYNHKLLLQKQKFLRKRISRKRRDIKPAIVLPSALVQNIAYSFSDLSSIPGFQVPAEHDSGSKSSVSINTPSDVEVEDSWGTLSTGYVNINSDLADKSKNSASSVMSYDVGNDELNSQAPPSLTLSSLFTPSLPEGLSKDSSTEHGSSGEKQFSDNATIKSQTTHVSERLSVISSDCYTDIGSWALSVTSIPDKGMLNGQLVPANGPESTLSTTSEYAADNLASETSSLNSTTESESANRKIYDELTYATEKTTIIDKPLSRQQRRWHKRKGIKEMMNKFYSNRAYSEPTNEVVMSLSPANIPVKIGHANAFFAGLTAYGDPGSGVTVVDSETLKSAKIPINKKNNPHMKLKVANESYLETIGTATFDVCVGPKVTKVFAFVVKSLPQKLILGTPWLVASKAIMDFDNLRIYFNDKKTGFVPISVDTNTPFNKLFPTNIPLVLEKNTHIPAFHESRCYVQATKRQRIETMGFTGLIESDNACAGLYGLLAATKFHTLTNEAQYIALMNTTDKPITLPKGTKVAYLTPSLSEDDYVHIPLNLINPQIPTTYQNNKEPLKPPENLPKEWENGWPPGFDYKFLIEYIKDEERVTKIKNLLQVRYAAFATDPDKPGTAHGIKLHIDTGKTLPIVTHPYRRPISEKLVITEMTNKMQKDDIIEPSSSSWSSPVLLVPKKGGKMRFCIDYRKLNAVTVKDVYPLPRIEECLSAFNNMEWFSVADCAAGYWGIEVDDESRAKTAFSTHDGHFQFKKMPFGLTNAPAVFMRLMNAIMSGILWKFCLPYMDDIMIFSKTFEEHLDHVDEVLCRLIDAGLTLKGSKCSLFRQEVTYLGHIVGKFGIKCDPQKLKAIQEMQIPKTLTELRSFLGLTGYYRRFIIRYSYLAKPLYDITQGSPAPSEVVRRFNKIDEHGNQPAIVAFQSLKAALLEAPILASPDFNKIFYLQTDACDFGISAILSQKSDDGTENLIACSSRKLNAAEQNYHTTEKEALAMVYGCEQFRHYLLGQEFYAETDHSALTQLQQTSNTGRLRRWALKLSEFQPKVVYKPGIKNGNADAASRLPVDEAPEDSSNLYDPSGYEVNNDKIAHVNAIEIVVPTRKQISTFSGPIGVAKILQGQLTDPLCKTIRAYLKYGFIPAKRGTQKVIKGDKEIYAETLLKLVQDSKMKFDIDPDTNLLMNTTNVKRATRTVIQHRIVVPHSLVPTIVQVYHCSPNKGGHMGRTKTMSRIKDKYFWNNMNRHIIDYIKACAECNKRKSPEPTAQGKLENYTDYKTSVRPFAMTQADVIGPLPLTAAGHIYALVATCHLTKWKVVIPIPDKSAFTVADTLLRHVFFQYGHPDTLLTDQGSEFTAEVTRRLCSRLGVDQRFSTAYHHNTVAQSERFTRFLKDVLSIYVDGKHNTWDTFLPSIVYCYNTSENDTTGDTPYYLMYGVDAREPSKVLVNMPYEEVLFDEHFYRLNQLKSLRIARNLTNQRIKDIREITTEIRNRTRKDIEFKVGDTVFLWTPPAYTKNDTTKFKFRYKGPYTVLRKVTNTKYEVEHLTKYRMIPKLDKDKQIILDKNNVPILEKQLTKGIVTVERMRLYNPSIKWVDFISRDLPPTEYHPPAITVLSSTPANDASSSCPSPTLSTLSITMSTDSQPYTDIIPTGTKRGIDALEIEKPVIALRDMPDSFSSKRRSVRNYDLHDQLEYGLVNVPMVNVIDPFEIRSYHTPSTIESFPTSESESYTFSDLNVTIQPYKTVASNILIKLMFLCIWSRPTQFKSWIPLDDLLNELDFTDSTLPRYLDRLFHILTTCNLIIFKNLNSMRSIALHPLIQAHIRKNFSAFQTETMYIDYTAQLLHSLSSPEGLSF